MPQSPKSHPRCAQATLALTAVLLFGGCSADTPPTLDACALVSTQEASSAAGTTVTQKALNPPTSSPDRASMCHYGTGKVSEGFMLLAAPLRKGVDRAHEIAAEKQSITADLKSQLGMTPKIEDLSGLGQAAFVVETPAFVQLHVFAGQAKLVFNMNGADTPRNVALARKLAAVAIGHLP